MPADNTSGYRPDDNTVPAEVVDLGAARAARDDGPRRPPR